MLLETGDYVMVHANQGWRDAEVLAVLEDKALVEYEMPNGSTALRIMRRHDDAWYRNVSYRSLPKKWLKELVDTQTEWIGRPQQTNDLAPLPVQLWVERGYSMEELAPTPY